MQNIKTLPLASIRTEGLQARCETNRAYVDDLAEMMADGWPAELPPLVVFFDEKQYWLADGHHRYQGAQEAGVTELPCEVREGDRTAALWFAIGANAEHGLRRTNEDKRRAVLLAYQLDPSLSDNAIANRCRVSPDMANYTLRPIRKEQRLSDSDSDTSPATSQTCDVEPPGDWYAPGAEPSDDPPQQPAGPIVSTNPDTSTAAIPSTKAVPADPVPDIRIDANGRKINVANIGKRKTDAPPATGTPSAPLGVDELGVPIPTEEAAQAFATLDHFADIDADLARVVKKIDALGKMPGAELLRSQYLKMKAETRDGTHVERFHSHDIDNARRELKHWQPYAATCPYCRGTSRQACAGCKGLAYITKSTFEQAPERLKNAVLAEARKNSPPC